MIALQEEPTSMPCEDSYNGFAKSDYGKPWQVGFYGFYLASTDVSKTTVGLPLVHGDF